MCEEATDSRADCDCEQRECMCLEGLLGPLSHDGHCTLEGTLSP